MDFILLVIGASLCAFATIFVFGIYDWFGFGKLSGMKWGSQHQSIGWDNVPLWKQATYRISQLVLYAIAYWLWSQLGDFGQAVGAGSLAGIPFMLHDLSFHIAGGHYLPGAQWNPFSMKEKRKPWSIHYWPIRAYVTRSDKLSGQYPTGVPYMYETFGRLSGIPVVIAVVALVLYFV